MISRANRFHGYNSLNHVYKKGKTARVPFMALRYADSREDEYRLAVVVSRKVSKSAVKRNRIRRRIYEVVRCEKQKSTAPWPYDLVLSVFDERLAEIDSNNLQGHVASLLKKANIIK